MDSDAKLLNNKVKTLQEFVYELNEQVKILDGEIGRVASGGFVPAGSVFFEDIPSLDNKRKGFTYNIKDAFTTTTDFMEGAGVEYPAGTNVAIVQDDLGNLKYDTLAGFIDVTEIYSRLDSKQGVLLTKEIAEARTVEEALENLDKRKVIVDNELSINSKNPVQNNVVTNALNKKLDKDEKASDSERADFATKAEKDAHGNNIVNTYLKKEDVVANPNGSPTGTLNKLKVGSTIYKVPQGGGGGGTSDYEELDNLPKVNGETLIGNKSSDELGLQKKLKAGNNISILPDGTISATGGGSTPSVDNETLVFS